MPLALPSSFNFASSDAGDSANALMESPPVQGLLSSIFMSLVVEAERDIRRRLSEKLATASWAPVALINVLALDDIEIARPVIAGSPVLTFAPLPKPADAPRNSLYREMERRFDAYKSRVVKPFFRDHFAKLDRQIRQLVKELTVKVKECEENIKIIYKRRD